MKLLPYGMALLAALLLAVIEGDLLYTAQEQNLFLHTPLFFKQQMVRSGGLLTWAGCYLTQFFYYPMLGAGVLGVLWALLVWLLKRTFRLQDAWMALAPVSCLLLTITMMGYWVFYLKLPGALFDATLGTILAVALVWVYRGLFEEREAWGEARGARCGVREILRMGFVVLTTAVTYPLFGFYGLLATVLMVLSALFSRRYADMLLGLLSIVAVPLVCYHTIYHETNIVNIYWTALPIFNHSGQMFMSYYIPYILLAILLGLFSGSSLLARRSSLLVPRTLLLVLSLLLLVILWQKDGNFHRELAMRRSIETQDWERVLTTAKAVKGEPTRAICLMRNLALSRLGQTDDQVLQYPDGAARPDASFSTRLVHTYGKVLYLEYGIPNYCYRWCMEDGVEYGWTVERLKLMTLCSLLNGEFVAAQRFVNILKKTDFHRSWASHYEAYLHRPALMVSERRLKPILPLLRSDNFLTADQSQLELFLIEHILSSPGATREQQELARFTMNYYQHQKHDYVER